jgi:hypothetical protein
MLDAYLSVQRFVVAYAVRGSISKASAFISFWNTEVAYATRFSSPFLFSAAWHAKLASSLAAHAASCTAPLLQHRGCKYLITKHHHT